MDFVSSLVLSYFKAKSGSGQLGLYLHRKVVCDSSQNGHSVSIHLAPTVWRRKLTLKYLEQKSDLSQNLLQACTAVISCWPTLTFQTFGHVWCLHWLT